MCVSKLKHSKGICCLLCYEWYPKYLLKSDRKCLLYYDIKNAYIIKIPSVYNFWVPTLFLYQDCLYYYDTKSAYFIMISLKRYHNSIGKYVYFVMISGLPTLLIQLWTFAYVRLLNKPYENEVTLRRQNLSSKYC